MNFLEKLGLPRTLGVILIFLLAVLLIVLVVYTIIPLVVVDLNTAFAKLSKLAERSWWGPLLSGGATQSLTAVVNRFSSQLISGGATPFGAFSDIFGGFLLGISVVVSSFYLSLTRDGVERFLRAVVPADYEEAALRIYGRSIKKIGSWFRAQIILSVAMGISVFIALILLKVKYPLLVSALAAIFEIVPVVGPILTGAVAFLVALITSPTVAFYTLIVFFIIHQLENHVLVPVFLGRSVGLHPVIVIIALLIGIEAGGVLGALASVPAAAVFQEVIEDWSVRKRPRQPALV